MIIKNKSRHAVSLLGLLLFLILAVGSVDDSASSVGSRRSSQKSPSTTPPQATAPKPSRQESVSPEFIFLHKWKPNDVRNGFGADVLLQQDLTEQHLVAFVKQLAGKHDPVIIRIWTSRTAWEEDEDAITAEFKSDYILFYVKNSTGTGAYRGFNEIRWMQEVGKYSHNFGKKTRF